MQTKGENDLGTCNFCYSHIVEENLSARSGSNQEPKSIRCFIKVPLDWICHKLVYIGYQQLSEELFRRLCWFPCHVHFVAFPFNTEHHLRGLDTSVGRGADIWSVGHGFEWVRISSVGNFLLVPRVLNHQLISPPRNMALALLWMPPLYGMLFLTDVGATPSTGLFQRKLKRYS